MDEEVLLISTFRTNYQRISYAPDDSFRRQLPKFSDVQELQAQIVEAIGLVPESAFAPSSAGKTSAANRKDPLARGFQSGREDLHRPLMGKRLPIVNRKDPLSRVFLSGREDLHRPLMGKPPPT